MIKITLTAALAGFLIALSLGIAWWYIQDQGLPSAGIVLALDKVTFWLWPTAIMMLPTENSGAFAAGVFLVMSSIANGFVYAMLAFGLSIAWKKLFRSSRLSPAKRAM